MPAPLQNRVTESPAFVVFATGFPTRRGPFQNSVANPCQGPLRWACWSSITFSKDGVAQTRDDSFRQFVITLRVEGYHRIHRADGLHLNQRSSASEPGGLPR